ncbi:uncharacterized protein FIBRA_00055 [Fibroporia radiculosa]|uniref:Methyltransferase domain-containing protein n=1 Tax=Fibroporia radiculosa TaxID=599839 RepID=J7SBR7_9APHY|nr:uncharacterized protein FIBRA_00055 [Fibroporia radiculosa]CCL98061.1 predicted protein [Fibroporia radiculosa]
MDHHAHAHSHDHGDAATAANKARFDKTAEQYDDIPGVLDMHKRQSAAIMQKYGTLFDASSTDLLDFACGTGLLSQALAPHVRSILGVDISNAMVDRYNARAAQDGFGTDEMHAICAELKEGNETELNGRKFDIVVCSAAYHHMTSIENTTRLLSSCLKPGGSLLITDMMASDDYKVLSRMPYAEAVPHKAGFDEATIRATFEGAGLVNTEYEYMLSATIHDTDVNFFLARGIKSVM